MKQFSNTFLVLIIVNLLSTFAAAQSSKRDAAPKPNIEQICQLIEETAVEYKIPASYFARLIWKESRFDHLALSPVGAQGIAQFMPSTAKSRGLENPFDYTQAIPASANFLTELQKQFGNLGLASAAYNAGPARVRMANRKTLFTARDRRLCA